MIQAEEIDVHALSVCGHLLKNRGLKLICAESMTAGYLSSIWALEVHSGDYFLGSLVCYDESTKAGLLHIAKEKIEKYSAESAVITLRMLDGLSQQFPTADVNVSITGLAFKSNNPKQKRPIGTVYYAFQYRHERVLFRKRFKGEASDIIIATCNSMIRDLYQWLKR